MDIIVHGTKGGRKTFTPKKISGLLDVSADASKATAIGQQAYGIRFTEDNTIFSKYKIIRDVRGDKRTGFLGFSLPIPYNKKLSGMDIINVLDEVSDRYCKKFIVDNNLDEITEDWTFLDLILDKYNDFIDVSADDVEKMQSGDKDDAFIYFKDNSELQKYFDLPFQEEYAPYRQVLFVESNLQGKLENPLNALRHSENDLTGKIDLENQFYKLHEFYGSGKNGVEIKIKNSKGRELHNNDKVYLKDELTVVYSKKYYRDEPIIGSLLNNEKLRKYLVVRNNNKIDVIKEIELEPETKKITIDVVTKKDDTKVTDAEIQVDDQPWENLLEIIFTAEELGREYKIAARKGDNLFSSVVKITPKEYSKDKIFLKLIEKRVVKITASDQENADAIWQLKVHIVDKGTYNATDPIEFVGDDIYKEWIIQIEKHKEYSVSENRKFCPATDGSEIKLKLQKANKQPNESENYGYNSPYSHDKGLKQKSYFAKITPRIWGLIVIGFLVFGVGIPVLCHFTDKEKQSKDIPLNIFKIEMYVEGDSLMLDKLNAYKENWKKQEQNFITKSGGGIFGGDENVDSTKWKHDWKPTYESIDRAIKKRELIDNKNIAELRNQRYANGQLSFKAAIDKIDSTKYEEISNQLGDVSALPLTQIGKKINEILIPKEPAKEAPQESKREENNQSKKQPSPQERKTAEPNITSEIIEYIKGSELDEAKLKDYRNKRGINQSLQNTIQLCLDFWVLDGSDDGRNPKTYFSFRNKVNEDVNFENSKLKAFIYRSCGEEHPSYSKQDKRKGLKQ